MILTGPEIKRQISLGRITIFPFRPEQINPNSYNYRLGRELLIFRGANIDPQKRMRMRRIKIPRGGCVLRPGKLYLGHTMEIIGSDHYAASLIGRSTVGRMGLWLQVTADLGHTGTRQRWTLEMKVVEPVRVYAGMKIGQVSFWKIEGAPILYAGRYAADRTATASRIANDFAFA